MMTKFAAHLTQRSAEIVGLDACRSAAAAGALRRQLLRVLSPELQSVSGLWRKIPIDQFEMETAVHAGTGVLVVEGMLIQPRELVLEELTRHKQTAQAFIPCAGAFLVAAAASLPNDPDQPDPSQVHIIRCDAGDAVILEPGAWHTLPFAIEQPVRALTVVHRLPAGVYHDVRDLPAEGWFGEIIT